MSCGVGKRATSGSVVVLNIAHHTPVEYGLFCPNPLPFRSSIRFMIGDDQPKVPRGCRTWVWDRDNNNEFWRKEDDKGSL